jgi:hypothetical protein
LPLELSQQYLNRKKLTPKFRDDALHIALASLANDDVLVRWYFKHIVYYDKIRLFNAVNIGKSSSVMNDRMKESDWKIFKELRPQALQRYCERVMLDVDKIFHDEEGNAHERYMKMYKIVRDGDKTLSRMFDGFSRSKALDQLVM